MMYGIIRMVGGGGGGGGLGNGQTKQIGGKAIFCLEFALKLDLWKFIYIGIWETPKEVLLQIVKSKMKCCIML